MLYNNPLANVGCEVSRKVVYRRGILEDNALLCSRNFCALGPPIRLNAHAERVFHRHRLYCCDGNDDGVCAFCVLFPTAV